MYCSRYPGTKNVALCLALTLGTFDGSEAIVPNGSLISNEVTNWTLSDRRRRIQMPVKVAFGNDPHKVMELLLKIDGEHPCVLDSPEP
ncbi:MAG: mechanosensitive ion channel [Candidatus Brocadiales bacterium]|nr:mechanosensitive ion channel [Candidatus Brocadiales bacterium]